MLGPARLRPRLAAAGRARRRARRSRVAAPGALRAPARERATRLSTPSAFAAAYAIMGAQRATKILGIFARLDRRDGKPQYLAPSAAHRATTWPRISPIRASSRSGSGIKRICRARSAAPLRSRLRSRDDMSSPTPHKRPWCSPRGCGKRMRPITETLPKPLVKVGGPGADRPLPRPLRRGRRRARRSSTSIGSPTRSKRISRRARRRTIVISDERERLLDQGGGIKRALPLHRRRAVLSLQHRRLLDRGAALQPAPPRRGLRPANDGRDAAGRRDRGRGRRRLAGRFHHGRARAG